MVGLEHVLVGLDGDGERLVGKGGLHLRDVAFGDESIGGNVDGGGAGLIVGARGNLAGSRCVFVDGLELSLVVLPVGEGLVLPATVASVVGSGAGNELLLGEGLEGSGSEEVGSFEGTSGRE